jgi:hypothetical protein
MIRSMIGKNIKFPRTACALLACAVIFSTSFAHAAQAPSNAAPPRDPAMPPQAITAILQPSLNTVHQTLQALRIDKWKKGSVRDEASANIDAIQNDLRNNLPALLAGADAASGTVTKLLPLSRHVAALYDVLLRVTEASRVAAPDDQAAQLQQALLGLSNARLALDDRMQGSAGALEKQVVDLRTSIATEAARRAAMPAPVALPCVPPPPVHKVVRRRRPAAKPATPAKPSTTAAKPSTSNGTTPAASH